MTEARLYPHGTPSRELPPGGFVRTHDEPIGLLGRCPRCKSRLAIGFVAEGDLWAPARVTGHSLASEAPLTIHGSIICPANCGAHYHVTGGRIEYAGDTFVGEHG